MWRWLRMEYWGERTADVPMTLPAQRVRQGIR